MFCPQLLAFFIANDGPQHFLLEDLCDVADVRDFCDVANVRLIS